MPQVEMSGDRRFRRVEIALFVLVIVAIGPLAHRMGEQQASRYAMTAAVWDEGTLAIDSYDHLLRRDRAVVDGRTYSDKAPGQPLLGVPFYGAYRAAGGSPAAQESIDDSIGLWWVTLWTATVPLGLLAVLALRWCRACSPTTALAATTTIVFGTLLLPYGALLFGHALAALCAFAAFLLVRSAQASRWSLVAAGGLAGAAVVTEYSVALIVLIVLCFSVVRHQSRTIWFLTGGLPAVLALLWYNAAVFGSPFVVSYQWSAFSDVADQPRSATAIFSGPTVSQFVDILFSQRGLVVGTPLTLAAMAGFWLLWRQGHRLEVATAAAAAGAMLVVLVFWSNPYAGGPGPRYFVPALPFLAVPVAASWARWRFGTRLVAAVSILTMVSATVTEPQLGSGFDAGLAFWLLRALGGDLAPSILTRVIGDPLGYWVHGLLFVAALSALVVANRWAKADVGLGLSTTQEEGAVLDVG